MKEFLSIKEVAEYLGVDYKTIYRLVQQAEIPAGKVGGIYRIRRQDVDAYFERQRLALSQQAARAAQIKCGRCLRLLAPHEIAGTCTAPDCEVPLCRACWEEDPDHRCRDHVLSPEERLHQAEIRLKRGEIPLLLTSAEARRREVFYLSRVEAKLRAQDAIRHPLTGRSLRVRDWDAIESRTEDLSRIREALDREATGAKDEFMPTNPRRTYRLGRDLALEAVVYSDLAAHLRQGFVTRPTPATTLFEILTQTIGRAEEEDRLIVLGLAATAGWAEEAAALIQGDGAGQRPFHHRRVAPVLVDLAADRLIFNLTDGRLDRLAFLFSPQLEIDRVQEIMTAVQTLLQTRLGGVLLSEMVERERVPAQVVSTAFDRLADAGEYEVRDVDKTERLILRRSA